MKRIDFLDAQIKKMQAAFNTSIQHAKTKQDAYKVCSRSIKELQEHTFKPLSTEINSQLFDKDLFADTTKTITHDIDIINSQMSKVINAFTTMYNDTKDYQTSIKNRLRYSNAIASSLQLKNKTSDEHSTTFRDSFVNYNLIHNLGDINNVANIGTTEGVATLNINSKTTLNDKISEITVSGNGIAGSQNIEDTYIYYNASTGYHNNTQEIIDGNADTYYEYSNTTDLASNIYLTVNIKLNGTYKINHIEITPFKHIKSSAYPIVSKIELSTDGAHYYSPSQLDKIDVEINPSAQHYIDQIYNNNALQKYWRFGSFYFGATNAQYIKITFKQNRTYSESYIQETYQVLSHNGTVVKTYGSNDALLAAYGKGAQYIIDGSAGEHKLQLNKHSIITIKKLVLKQNKDRFLIALRDINIGYVDYKKTSSIISKLFETTKPIKVVTLDVSEIIPTELIKNNLSKRNEYIEYYISFDDKNWLRISPLQHRAINNSQIHPQIYHIVPLQTQENSIDTRMRLYKTDDDIKQIRFKVIFNSKDEDASITPMLEEYNLKCILGDTNES